ncbi:MAG: hypothetical protein ACRDH6_01500 [Actinomycetota bacterium]
MRRLAFLLATVVLTGGVPASGQEQATSEDTRTAIQALLDTRTQAMRDGDLAGFLATIDPDQPQFVIRQRLLFQGFQRLGLSEYELSIGNVVEELTTNREVKEYGAEAAPAVYHVEERYQIAGFDPRPTVADLFLTFVRTGDGWRIAADDDLEDAALLSERPLWSFGPIVTKRSRHFLFVSHPDLATAADSVLSAAEQALELADARWPLPWRRRVVVFAPSTSEELISVIQAAFDPSAFVAFAVASTDRSDGWRLVGPRIVVHWPNFAGHSQASRISILTHELAHIAARQLAGPFTPTFVDEGVAEWVRGVRSLGALPALVHVGAFDRQLPQDFEFYIGSLTEITTIYDEASSAIGYAVDRFGIDAVADFYRRLGRARLAPGTWRYHVDRAMRSVLGISFSVFERQWASWIQEAA